MKNELIILFKIILLQFFICSFTKSFSQQTSSQTTGIDPYTGNHVVGMQLDRSYDLANMIDRRPATKWNSLNKPANYRGTPFLFDEYMEATIETNDSLKLVNVPVKLNLLTNEIHYLSNNQEKIARYGIIKSISFHKPQNDSINYIFKSGFRDKISGLNSFLFEVLSEGKITLLNQKYKTISFLTKEITKEYDGAYKLENDFFVYFNKNLEKAKLTKTFFFDRFKEETLPMIEEFIVKNNINFKNNSDIIKLVKYYNSIVE